LRGARALGRFSLKFLILGATLASAIAALYLAAGMPALPGIAGEVAAAIAGRNLTPGFVGMMQFGQWRLICVPGPGPGIDMPSSDLPASNSAPARFNACRVNQEVTAAGNPDHVIIAANLSVVGANRSPVLMLRMPPTAQTGEKIALELEEGPALETTVRSCTKRECLAAGEPTREDWTRLVASRTLRVTFPAPGRQMVFVDLGTNGLAEAASAMTLAQTATR
jgi:invasion protein IalB